MTRDMQTHECVTTSWFSVCATNWCWLILLLIHALIDLLLLLSVLWVSVLWYSAVFLCLNSCFAKICKMERSEFLLGLIVLHKISWSLVKIVPVQKGHMWNSMFQHVCCNTWSLTIDKFYFSYNFELLYSIFTLWRRSTGSW